jgi:hypothetical protein
MHIISNNLDDIRTPAGRTAVSEACRVAASAALVVSDDLEVKRRDCLDSKKKHRHWILRDHVTDYKPLNGVENGDGYGGGIHRRGR